MRTRRWVLALLAPALLLVPLPTQAAEPAAPVATPDKVVTLITGDQVVLRGGDRDRVSIVQAAGREQVGFESRRTAEEWTVMPSDVRAAVQSGQLDRRLFDLDLLVRDGYDDAARGDIPVLVTGSTVAAREATTVRALKSGTALSVPKAKAAGFLQQFGVQGIGRQTATGTKIWLDRTLHTSLDHSVPQIGAPAAWQAGYTGKGVTVAVLDSGIDSTHPDLAGQVVAAKNFTADPAADTGGHGTHVASTIAGKGTNGHRGVAPDAKLLDGKVCDDFGYCSESTVLAGVEWAVAQQAKVVNLSLGGPAGDETDPLEQALDRFTREAGTLFVVAAGNNGREVESPGTAASALTVGAIDADEKLADFSAPGPGRGGAIKPDLTAPGVGIVAARAGGSHPEEPVGDRYAKMSGTSMATPHAAGAAALLAQQHAGWKAPELKAALTSTAKANPELTPYQQGSGRVDVARAVGQSVVAATTSVSFGTARWPHADDQPVTRQVTYRNFGSTPVTLDLRAELKAGSSPAPAGALRLSAERLTVAAGGEASVQIVSDTTHAGPDGLYTGRLLATAGAQQVVVPLVVDKEVESYDVAVTTLGADGKPVPAGQAFVSFARLDSWEPFDGRDVTRLPKGKYVLDATVFGPAGQHYRIVQPEFDVRRDAAVVLDVRTAKPVKVSVPRADARGFVSFFGYQRRTATGGEMSTWNLQPLGDQLFLGRLGRPVPNEQFKAFLVSYLGRLAPDGSLAGSPFVYGLVDTRRGQFFDGFRRTIHSDRQLAHVVAQYRGPAGTEDSWRLVGRQPGVDTMPIGAPVTLPHTVHQYLEPRTNWQQAFADETREPRQYKPGTTTTETWTHPTPS
ncbi:peptidase S8 and S53 subtilisin kexin sedolisin [Kribbella flavida DSM 17836]|uniref:Peptidase S8 and S53 subtilisin kexin sedolisin n=1 Tax=Kribbella flavida (strain DSM 17836 / JCM 10339 / NBRC 14399) TaxID=479435 RepID=D2PUS5_KRIFD|nr:S8 family serine peptidase [Kribbella flavida]ADB31391.1 peptidase S8 and S53 subtilisin kexin sedolisin [Kribbella flavida DSM 17836]